MKNLIYTLLFFVPVVIMGQTTTKNYLLETNYEIPVLEANITNVTTDNKIEVISYSDCLGS
jgi:hypothetical protein